MKRIHLWFAVFMGATLVLRLALTIFAPDVVVGEDPGLITRLIRFVSYFTIESNLAVFLASLAVVRGADLSTPWMRTLRLASLVGITVTGIVYVVVLSGEAVDRALLSSVANIALHYLSPALAVVIWAGVGPWPGFTWSDVGRVMLWAVIWGGWTLLHGAVTDWYPYPFIDVTTHGYGQVAVNFVFVVLFAAALGALFTVGDRWRSNRGQAA